MAGARLLGTPIEIVAATAPARPIVVETGVPTDTSVDAVYAATWDPTTLRARPVVVDGVGADTERVRGQSDGVGALGFVAFAAPGDGQRWLAGQGLDYLGEFFDAPYDCTAPDFGSAVLESVNYPVSTALQVYPIDKNVSQGVVSMSICTKLRFAMAYDGAGAGTISGYALPRSELKHDVRSWGAPATRSC